MSFDIALSGIQAINDSLDVTSHNIANAGTYGYKASRANFSSMYAGDRATGHDEPGDVGDRVANRVAAAVALEMKRLIEVARTLGIERREGDVAKVEFGHGRRRCLSFGDHILREVDGGFGRLAQSGERRGQFGLGGRRGDV